MDNTPEQRRQYDDEISLVDLATTFIRRRNIFYATFVVVIFLGVIYALIAPEKYEYVTLIQSAEKGNGEFLEKPASTVATLTNRWVPGLTASHAELNEEKLPFEIKISNPEDTGLIRLSSEAITENADLVKSTHQKLVDSVLAWHQQSLEARQKSIKNQVLSVEKVVESLQSTGAGENTGTALAAAIEKRADLESRLELLKPAESLVVSRQSIERKGPARSLIVVLAAVLGGMLGVFASFFAEFALVVRSNLAMSAESATSSE